MKFYMDETTYERFHRRKNFLEAYSAEDWARMQVKGFERKLWASGCPQRLRLDNLEVRPDDTLDPTTDHQPKGYRRSIEKGPI